MLQAPGDPNDGDKQKESKNDVDQCDPQSGNEQPDDVEQAKKATGECPFIHLESAAKRPQTQGAYLDQLETKWDTYNGDHHGHSSQEIANCGGQTAKNEPDDVTKEIHKQQGWVAQI